MSDLARAAFGDRPDLPVTAVPADPHERWLAAVVLGGQARYAAAAALLTDLVAGPDPELAALAAATLASHRRQLGGHAAARVLDARGLHRLAAAGRLDGMNPGFGGEGSGEAGSGGAGLGGVSSGGVESGGARPGGAGSGGAESAWTGAGGSGLEGAGSGGTRLDVTGVGDAGLGETGAGRAGAGGAGLGEAGFSGTRLGGAQLGGTPSDRAQLYRAEAISDVLVGLAADAVGVGRLAEARRLHARAPAPTWRTRIRSAWVSAEIELSSGRATLAVPHAERAAGLAADAGSVRHRIKSDLVLAAALGVVGERAVALKLVTRARDDATDLGLLSLVWPAAMILADLNPSEAGGHCRTVALTLHGVLRRADPRGRELAERSPWVPAAAGPTG